MRFEKVSLDAFAKDMIERYPNFRIGDVTRAWENITLPKRSTEYSAGYDICTPFDLVLPSDVRVVVPTGIKVVFTPDEAKTWHLQMYVRSSVGIKQGVVLTNGTGIIDPDYQFAENDGDMMLALLNTSDKIVKYKAGDRICQAVFAIHGRTSDDTAEGKLEDFPHGDVWNVESMEEMVDRIKQLPSAQPEIIRCKDCKHWIPYDWMFSEVWQSKNIADYPEDEIGCDCCDMAMKANDFCSRVERRTE